MRMIKIFFGIMALIRINLSYGQTVETTLGVKAYYILSQLINDHGIANKEVRMMIVDFPPRSSSLPHRHPCPTFGYVLEGAVESTFEGNTKIYRKGDSFYEIANGLHSIAKNPDKRNHAKLWVFYIIDPGKETSIQER